MDLPLKLVISSMKNNITPGMDGLTAVYYKTVFKYLCDILIEVDIEINTDNSIPKSVTRAVTVVT